MKRYNLLFTGTLVLCLAFMSGCDANWHPPAWWATWLDPTKTIAASDSSELMPILPQVDAVDEYQAVVPNAEPPTLADLQWSAQEYALGPGDVLDISVLSLFTEGTEALLRRQISNAGYIDLPLLPNRVSLNGMTVEQARQMIVKAYAPAVLKEATVSISVSAPRQNIFSILGSVARPSTYPIIRSEFRLLEALALAGDQTEKEIEYIYVIRLTSEARALGPGSAGPAAEPQKGMTPENLPAMPGTSPAPSGAPAAPTAEEAVRELQRFMPNPGEQAAPGTQQAVPGTQQTTAPGTQQAVPSAETVLPPAAAVVPPVTPPAAQSAPKAPVDANEAARRELEQFMPGGQAQPETGAVKPSMIHLTDVEASTGTAQSADNGAEGYTWVYENGQWVRVRAGVSAKPAVATATAQPVAQAPVAAQPVAQAPAAPPITADNTATDAALPLPTTGSIEAQVRVAQAAAARRALPAALTSKPSGSTTDPYGWATADMSNLARVIVIDMKKLKNGEPRQNIIIRDNDVVLIPSLPVGEFYIFGEVARPGVYNITGRKVTAKQAIAAAGDLGPLSWPSNSVLIRRIGDNQELRIPLHLDLIMEGREPDILLKPDDVIAVGTHISAPFLAVMRNAFRLTYGFGFIYDRNYAEKNVGQFHDFFN